MKESRGFEPLAFRFCSCEHRVSKQAKTIYKQDLNTHWPYLTVSKIMEQTPIFVTWLFREPLWLGRACGCNRGRTVPPPSGRRYFVLTHSKAVAYFHLVNRLLLKASSFVIKNSYLMAPKGRLCENFSSWRDTLDDILVNSKSPISVCWKLSYSSILFATILII